MLTTMGTAGRVVIPKAIRDAAYLAAGDPLEIVEHDGRIEIRAVPVPVHLIERDGFLAAETDQDGPPLTTDEVRSLLERHRR